MTVDVWLCRNFSRSAWSEAAARLLVELDRQDAERAVALRPALSAGEIAEAIRDFEMENMPAEEAIQDLRMRHAIWRTFERKWPPAADVAGTRGLHSTGRTAAPPMATSAIRTSERSTIADRHRGIKAALLALERAGSLTAATSAKATRRLVLQELGLTERTAGPGYSEDTIARLRREK